MPSLKDLRNRISSVKATQKITRAMQMVAAAKLRRAQEAAVAARPYADRMDRVLANLNRAVTEKEGASPLLVGTGKDETHLLIVATAERGLRASGYPADSRRAGQHRGAVRIGAGCLCANRQADGDSIRHFDFGVRRDLRW